MITFYNCFFEVSIKAKYMTIKMNPIWLVELRRIFVYIFRVEMIMGSGEVRSVVDNWLLICLLSWERISSGFLLVDISIFVLLDVTNFFIVLFELLSGCEAW